MTNDLFSRVQQAIGPSYTIERELSGGGMSRVLVALDSTLNRRIAIKVLSPDLAAAVNHHRFRREIQIAAFMQHPHIVPVIATGEADGLPYYSMPFVSGESLRARIARDGPLSIGDALTVLRDVARALAYAHRHDVVHRDIKPENILLTEDSAVVADFGIAKALWASRTPTGPHDTLTQVGSTVGTPVYMAPEQAVADASADYRIDLYAFGVVAYEVLTGKPPFGGRPLQAIIAAHLTEQPVPLLRLRSDVPPEIDRLVMRCLEKDPRRRPQSATEILQALDAVTVSTRTSWARLEWLGHARRRAGALAAIGVVLGAIIVGWVLARERTSTAAPARAGGESVAVLPFDNVGGDTANLYFADGMTDELAAALARVPGLRVAARSSAYRFRGQAASTKQIGRELHVGKLLEGSIRRAGGRLRVTAQLVNTSDGLAVWSDRYEREVRDVFDVQDELTRAIVAALAPTLATRSTQTIPPPASAHGTNDLVAYDLYLQGHYFWEKRGEGSLRRAISLYQQAIARDPKFARAWAGLAMCYSVLSGYSETPLDSTVQLTLASARRALAIDSMLPTGHLALAEARMFQWQWDSSEAHLKQALVLDSMNVTGHHWYGLLLLYIGRPEESIGHLQRAAVLDPLAPVIGNALTSAYLSTRRYDDAIVVARRSFALDTTSTDASKHLAEVYLHFGQVDSAIVAAHRALELGRAVPGTYGLTAWYLAKAGRRAEAESLLTALRGGLPRRGTPPVEMALAHVGLGNRDSALVWLARAVDRRDPSLLWDRVACDPLWDTLRSDPRFTSIARRMNIRTCATGALAMSAGAQWTAAAP